jgi:hypothetical protein
MGGRRSKDDEKWQAVKEQVQKLDKCQCLLCMNLSATEMKQFENSIRNFSTHIIDPAHYKAVSQRPDLIYDVNNIYSLCRQMHERIDHCMDPVTGDFCDSQRTEYWWQRIIEQRRQNLEQAKLKSSSFYLGDLDTAVEPETKGDGFFYEDF